MPRATAKVEIPGSRTQGEGSTREAILNVAEHRFAEAGYDGASVRDIQRAANANGGAVFYYFGAKQTLFEAVFERLAEPLVEERLRRLSLCAEAPGAPPLLEQILAAYLAPGLQDGFESSERRWHFAQIRAQLLQAHHPFMKDILARHFTRTGEAFLTALARAQPELEPRDLQWRYHTMVGALTFTMGGPGRLQLGRLAGRGPIYNPGDLDETLSQMITLMAAMFRAPAVFARPDRTVHV